MSLVEKATILAQVESLSRSKRQILVELGVPRSTYYPVATGAMRPGKEKKAVEPAHP